MALCVVSRCRGLLLRTSEHGIGPGTAPLCCFVSSDCPAAVVAGHRGIGSPAPYLGARRREREDSSGQGRRPIGRSEGSPRIRAMGSGLEVGGQRVDKVVSVGQVSPCCVSRDRSLTRRGRGPRSGSRSRRGSGIVRSHQMSSVRSSPPRTLTQRAGAPRPRGPRCHRPEALGVPA